MGELAQIGLVRTTGFSSWLIRLVTHSHWNHVILRVTPHYVVSAETSGVATLPVTHFTDVTWSAFPLTDRQQAKIIAFALQQVGKPYGVLTYLWVGIGLLTKAHTPRWLEKKLSDQTSWTCSQLADSSYHAAGWYFFDDDRPASAVYPGSFVPFYVDAGWLPEGTH